MATEPDDADRGDLHDQHRGGEHDDEEITDAEADVGEVVVRLSEAAAFDVLAHEGADDADARELLAHHSVDAVEAVLELAEERNHAADDGAHKE